MTFATLTEKLEDARAKAAIKAQIEADKKARAEKFAREKAIRDGQPIPGEPSAPAPAPKPTPPSGVAGKDFKETRLQIRMSTGGQPYTTTLSSDAGKLYPNPIQVPELIPLLATSQCFGKLRNFWLDKL